MTEKTKEVLDGVAMLVIAMGTPVGAWITAGAPTDLASIAGVIMFSLVAGATSMRLWLRRDPRAEPLPEVKP